MTGIVLVAEETGKQKRAPNKERQTIKNKQNMSGGTGSCEGK